MPRNLDQLAASLEELLDDGRLLNLQAQAHARTILSQLDTPRDEWPRFTASLDERLLYGAHLMLVRGMELVDTEGRAELSKRLLLRGAESLEFVANVPQSRLSQFDERVNAAIAYHVAGYHARSYVMVSRLTEEEQTGVTSDALAPGILALLRRDLRDLSASCIRILANEAFQDVPIAAGLRGAEFQDDEAIAALGRRSLCEALLRYLEYAKRGDAPLLEVARAQCRDVALLGEEAGHVDLWWLGLAVEKLLHDLGDSSLWQGLSDLSPTSPYGGAIDRYIEAGLRTRPSTVTLWPSQRKALGMIKAGDAPSFCIRMPTSAGKTKIAEFCILRTLLESGFDDDAKCLYIAPFRSLAVEVEATLSKGLRPLGIRVSEIYGGFDLTTTDERLIRDTQVLVATPEKFDAAVRLAPELLEKVRLVIIDEGQIAGEFSARGLRAEFLINRLLWRLGRETCRHVFISAVLPNPREFAAWIGGDEDNVVESEWRPSRLILGECEWSKKRGSVRLSFTHDGAQPFDQEVFIQPFVTVREVRGVPGCGRRRKSFPNDAGEAFAACALRFARYGTTLAFVPQARQVDSTARTLLVCIGLSEALAESEGEVWDFPVPDDTSPLMLQALEMIADELGADSEVENFLRNGIAIHRGSLPARVKVAIERLVRSGEIRLVVATTTLGQGVNLPIRTVLVRGLQQDQTTVVNPMTFWNIAGRAGRAMHEIEGQVLFFNDIGRKRSVVRRQRRAISAIIDRSAIEQVVGCLHRILGLLSQRWEADAPDMTFEDLCLKLSEDDFDWARDSIRDNLRSVFDLVDQHLLALAIEGEFGPDQQDALQEVLRESLLFAQLEAHPIDDIDATAAREVLAARVRWVFRRVPQSKRREQFYRMGMLLTDCETIEAMRDELLDRIREAEAWAELDDTERLDLLQSIAQLATHVQITSEAARSVPGNVLEIVRAWLAGHRCVEMIEAGLGEELNDDPGKLGRFLEEYCVYGMAWVVSGFVSFAREELEAEGEELPAVVEHFPALFKVGVCDPLAAVLVPYVQMDRGLSTRLAALCPYAVNDVARAIAWLHGVSRDELVELGLTTEDAEAVTRKRRQLPELNLFDFDNGSVSWTVRIRDGARVTMRRGDPVIIHPRADLSPAHYDVLDLNGNRFGSFRLATGELPHWMSDPVGNVATVDNLKLTEDGSMLLRIRARELAG